jgi:hypothetical protein
MSFKITAESDLWESRGTFTLGVPKSQRVQSVECSNVAERVGSQVWGWWGASEEWLWRQWGASRSRVKCGLGVPGKWGQGGASEMCGELSYLWGERSDWWGEWWGKW